MDGHLLRLGEHRGQQSNVGPPLHPFQAPEYRDLARARCSETPLRPYLDVQGCSILCAHGHPLVSQPRAEPALPSPPRGAPGVVNSHHTEAGSHWSLVRDGHLRPRQRALEQNTFRCSCWFHLQKLLHRLHVGTASTRRRILSDRTGSVRFSNLSSGDFASRSMKPDESSAQ